MPFPSHTPRPYFNSRPSARGDSTDTREEIILQYFNSRPSARGDDIAHITRFDIVISIHAPPRGATRAVLRAFAADTQFQFTPLREGRRRATSKPRTS